MLPDKPSTREELYLDSIATNNTAELPAKPCTRKEQYLEYIALNGGGSGAVVTITGDSGTLTAAQITDVLKDNTIIENDGQMFYLSNKMSTLTYRTFINVDTATSELDVHAIYVQLNEEAVNYGHWTKEQIPDGDASWGNITGTLANQSDLQTALNAKANTSDLPTVNNATLTIQKNGTNVQTFTANSSTNKTANITVPTKTSDLTNDSGYQTDTQVTSAVSAEATLRQNGDNALGQWCSALEASIPAQGSIASGNTGYVTGGDVYTAIGNVESAINAIRGV